MASKKAHSFHTVYIQTNNPVNPVHNAHIDWNWFITNVDGQVKQLN